MRKCSKCKTKKPLSEFWKSVKNKEGLNVACKDCCSAWRKDYNKNNPEKIKEYSQRSYSKHRAKNFERTKEWQELHPERKQGKEKGAQI